MLSAVGHDEVYLAILVNLRNRAREERWQQTSCDKRDYDFCLIKPSTKLHIPVKQIFL